MKWRYAKMVGEFHGKSSKWMRTGGYLSFRKLPDVFRQISTHGEVPEIKILYLRFVMENPMEMDGYSHFRKPSKQIPSCPISNPGIIAAHTHCQYCAWIFFRTMSWISGGPSCDWVACTLCLGRRLMMSHLWSQSQPHLSK